MLSSLLLASVVAALAPGEKAPEFTLPVATAQGGQLALKDTAAKNKLTVVMFIATQCPVSNNYNERMAQLANDYATKGVAFVGVNSNKQEPVAEIGTHAKENKFAFPVVKDDQNKIADAYGARVTPEIFVIDATGVVRYHGRIDERQEAKSAADIKSPDLRTALDALLAGKQLQPAQAATKAFGCSIKRI